MRAPLRVGEEVINMKVTMQQVTDILDVDEPNYPEAVRLGPGALPHLDTLVKTADAMLASKATYLASLIQDEQSINVLKTAASSKFPEVRVAAAAGARNLKSTISTAGKIESNRFNDLLSSLKDDNDVGVKKEALKSLKSFSRTE
jgi:HEAT repeat protein